MKGQDLGNNTGTGRLPFPVREKTVQPIAASAKAPCALLPRFTGGAVAGANVSRLEITERREGRCLVVDLYAPPGAVARRQIYVGYTGGVHVLANGHATETLTATVGGKTYTVRPRGFRGWTDDGQVLVEN